MGFAKPVTIAFGRTATISLVVSIGVVLLLSGSLLLAAARVQNERAAEQIRHFASILLENRAQSLARKVVDYADWGEAYRNLHLTVSTRWAWDQNNVGSTLGNDLGIETLAVFDDAGRAAYSVLDGMPNTDPTLAFAFARERVSRMVEDARKIAASSHRPTQSIVAFNGVPMLIAAAAMGPGGDETVKPDDRISVMVFGDWLTPKEMDEFRLQLGVARLRLQMVDPRAPFVGDIVFTSGDPDRAIAMITDYPAPGTAMLWSLMPWASGFVLVVGGFVAVLVQQGMRSARQGYDLTQALRAASREAEYQAFHDTLTGLPNRASFQNAIRQALRLPIAELALFYLDLDQFKMVNDRFGHGAGDHVLREVAKRLVLSLPTDDVCARIGGDEFVILAKTSNRYELGLRARRIIRSMCEPIQHDREVFHVGVTIGIAVASAGDDPETLMKSADAALYRAKDAGRGRFHIAGPDPTERAAAVA